MSIEALAVVSTLEVESNPPNPSQIAITATSVTTHIGARIVSETLYVIGDTRTEQWDWPLPDKIDCSNFHGQPVTFRYVAEDDTGAQSEFVDVPVQVPAFVLPERTVRLDQPRQGTNWHAIQDAINDCPDGGLITVYPGDHQLANGTNGNTLRMGGRSALTLRGSTPSVTIDGNRAAHSSNYAFGFSSGQRCTIKDIQFTNCRWAGVGFQSLSVGCAAFNVQCDDGDRFGFQVYGTGGNFPNDSLIHNCRAARNGFITGAGSGVHVTDGAIDTQVSGGTFDGNRLESIQVTLGRFNATGTTLIKGNTCLDANRTNIIIQNSNDVIVDGNLVVESEAAGIQVENDVTRCAVINNILLRNNIQRSVGGECQIWIDDSADVIVENNRVGFEEDGSNAGGFFGIRVDGDLGTDTDRKDPASGHYDPDAFYNLSLRVIVRNNRVAYCGQNPHPEARQAGVVGCLNFQNVQDVSVYNNTFFRNGATTLIGGTARNGWYSNNTAGSLGPKITERVILLNNVLNEVENWSNHSDSLWWSLDGAEFTKLDNNLYWDGPSLEPYALGAEGATVRHDFPTYQSTVEPLEEQSQEVDPLTDPITLRPLTGSPCLYAGQPLATITEINGNAITVDTPHVFHSPIGLGTKQIRDRIVFANNAFAYVASVSDTTILVDQLPAGVQVGQSITSWVSEHIGVATPDAHDAKQGWDEYRAELPKGLGSEGERPQGDNTIQYRLRSGHRLFVRDGEEVPTMDVQGTLLATKYGDTPTADENAVVPWRGNVDQIVEDYWFRPKREYVITFDFEIRDQEYNPNLFLGRLFEIQPTAPAQWSDSWPAVAIILDRITSGGLDLRCRLRGSTHPDPSSQGGANFDNNLLLQPFQPGTHHVKVETRWDWEADANSYCTVTVNNRKLLEAIQPIGWNYSESSEPNAAMIKLGWTALTDSTGILVRFDSLEVREVM